MKRYQALILLILFNIYTSKDYCDPSKYLTIINPKKAEDCISASHDGGYCCYVKLKYGNACRPVGPNEYKYIADEAVIHKKCSPKYDFQDDCEEYEDYSIECKSYYLVYSLSSLILLLL